jgi:hypothetical protein
MLRVSDVLALRRVDNLAGEVNPFLYKDLSEPTGRFELPASGLRNRCSTTELRRQERVLSAVPAIPRWIFFGIQAGYDGGRASQ